MPDKQAQQALGLAVLPWAGNAGAPASPGAGPGPGRSSFQAPGLRDTWGPGAPRLQALQSTPPRGRLITRGADGSSPQPRQSVEAQAIAPQGQQAQEKDRQQGVRGHAVVEEGQGGPGRCKSAGGGLRGLAISAASSATSAPAPRRVRSRRRAIMNAPLRLFPGTPDRLSPGLTGIK